MTLRVVKNRPFTRWATGESLTDVDLCQAAREIESGLIDAKLGGFLLKKRVARAHGGKNGGFRVIGSVERKALLKLGDEYMALSDNKLDELIQDQVMIEVTCDAQEESYSQRSPRGGDRSV